MEPIEEQKLKELRDIFYNMPQKEIAERIKRSTNTVRYALNLGFASPDTLKELETLAENLRAA